MSGGEPSAIKKRREVSTASNMYAAAETWNPFKGCKFDCAYCVPSFQAQAKRQKHRCEQCYNYEPHEHAERLAKIPSADIVFVAGNGDLAFCPPKFIGKLLDAIEAKNAKRPDITYYLQSKRPACLAPFVCWRAGLLRGIRARWMMGLVRARVLRAPWPSPPCAPTS